MSPSTDRDAQTSTTHGSLSRYSMSVGSATQLPNYLRLRMQRLANCVRLRKLRECVGTRLQTRLVLTAHGCCTGRVETWSRCGRAAALSRRPSQASSGWRAEGGRGQLSRSSVVMRVAAGSKKSANCRDTLEHQIQQRNNATRSARKRAMFSRV